MSNKTTAVYREENSSPKGGHTYDGEHVKSNGYKGTRLTSERSLTKRDPESAKEAGRKHYARYTLIKESADPTRKVKVDGADAIREIVLYHSAPNDMDPKEDGRRKTNLLSRSEEDC